MANMESQHQKWVTASYLAVAALLGYIVFAASQQLIGTYDLEARIPNVEIIARVVSIVAGGVLLFGLLRNESANRFMNEVVEELGRVTWPTQKETSSATFVVIVMVLISGMLLGALDYLWTRLLQWVL